MLSHISEDVVAGIHLLSSLEKDNYVRLWCHQKLTSEALYCLKKVNYSVFLLQTRQNLEKKFISRLAVVV